MWPFSLTAQVRGLGLTKVTGLAEDKTAREWCGLSEARGRLPCCTRSHHSQVPASSVERLVLRACPGISQAALGAGIGAPPPTASDPTLFAVPLESRGTSFLPSRTLCKCGIPLFPELGTLFAENTQNFP